MTETRDGISCISPSRSYPHKPNSMSPSTHKGPPRCLRDDMARNMWWTPWMVPYTKKNLSPFTHPGQPRCMPLLRPETLVGPHKMPLHHFILSGANRPTCARIESFCIETQCPHLSLADVASTSTGETVRQVPRCGRCPDLKTKWIAAGAGAFTCACMLCNRCL